MASRRLIFHAADIVVIATITAINCLYSQCGRYVEEKICFTQNRGGVEEEGAKIPFEN